MHPTLSIAILTKNRSHYLREALAAILCQTYPDFEVLVMDNHSEDDTHDVVKGFKDRRITYIRHPEGGTPDTNNQSAIWMSRGHYVLTTHDDDVMEPHLVERAIAFLKANPKTLALASNVSLIDEHSVPIQSRLYEMDQDRTFEKGDYIRTYLDEKLWFPTPTLIFRRDNLVRVTRGATRSTLPTYFPSGDIWTLFILNLHGPISLLHEPLLKYRQHSGQESRNVDQSEPLVKLIELLIKHRGGNPVVRHMLSDIHAARARFQSQDVLFKKGIPGITEGLTRKLELLKVRWEQAVAPESRAMDSVLPFEILMCTMGFGATIPPQALATLCTTPTRSLATLGYRQWTQAAQQGVTLFDATPGLKRIAILGSMFTAFLLVQEARRAGIEVVACLDSAPARIGRKVLGVPVVPHAAIRTFPATDLIVLSNERDHEAAIKEILAPNLVGMDIPVVSWKDLARTNVNAEACPLGCP